MSSSRRDTSSSLLFTNNFKLKINFNFKMIPFCREIITTMNQYQEEFQQQEEVG